VGAGAADRSGQRDSRLDSFRVAAVVGVPAHPTTSHAVGRSAPPDGSGLESSPRAARRRSVRLTPPTVCSRAVAGRPDPRWPGRAG
jgi:hypothetical protein